MAGGTRIIPLGTNATWSFETKGANGVRKAPDSAPTVAYVHVNGVLNAGLSPVISVAQDSTPADIDGLYLVNLVTNMLNNGDDVAVALSATIDGTTVTEIIQGVVMDAGGGPQIDA